MSIQQLTSITYQGTYVLCIALSVSLTTACQADNNGLNDINVEALSSDQFSPDLCSTTEIADYKSLTQTHNSLPNPFIALDGSKITTKKQWECNQQSITAQVQKYMLGELPQDHPRVETQYQQNILTVTVTRAGHTISFDAQVILPTVGQAPYPAMIGIGRVSLNNQALLDQGIALINFPNNDLAEQLNGTSRGKGKFYELYGTNHSAGALMAWAWGVSRLIDGLQTTTNIPINSNKLGVTGCSRNGKGAVMAGAFDPRIVLTLPQESGAGGSANWRISAANLIAGENVQTLRQIVTENVWFTQNFAEFSDTVNLLPFDQHQVLGLIAPRALLIVDNAIDWLGIESSYVNAVAAKSIWQSLDTPNAMGVSQTLTHQHCQQPESQQAEINAFVQTYLLDTANQMTTVDVNENNIVVDKQRWLSWSTPKLK
jgi:hypothetical protein